MNKGHFGSGIIGFILGLLSCGLFWMFKNRNKTAQTDYTINDTDHHEIIRVTKK